MHSSLYVVPFLPLVLIMSVPLWQVGLLVLAMGISYFLVDLTSRRDCSFTSLIIDQGIHVAFLMAMAMLFPLSVPIPASYVGIGFALLLIFKPSRVIFFRVFSSLALPAPSEKQETVHAGNKIGYLERLIILLLCLFGAISTCALVIAAKTLVRYAEFSNDSAFREVFLVGTLMSLCLALIGYGVARLLMGYCYTRIGAVEQDKEGYEKSFPLISVFYACP